MGLTIFVILGISHLSESKFINQVFSHFWKPVICKQFDLWYYAVWHIIGVYQIPQQSQHSALRDAWYGGGLFGCLAFYENSFL